jgi:hypothetical protein
MRLARPLQKRAGTAAANAASAARPMVHGETFFGLATAQHDPVV